MTMQSLAERIKTELLVANMIAGVYVEDMNDGEALTLEADRSFPSASAIKTAIAIHILKLVEKGKLSFQDTISMDLSLPEYQQPMGSGVLTNLNSKVSLNLRDILLLSLAESDNLATNELLKLCTMPEINQTLEGLGLKTTRVTSLIHDFERLALPESNPATARELGMLFKRLYLKQLPYSDVLLDILMRQKYVSRIPYFLPEFDPHLSVANKTGSVGGFIHDSALISRPEFNYVIVILSHSEGTWRNANLTLARVADLVYSRMLEKYSNPILV